MSDYKVHKRWIESAEFEILILELPSRKAEVEDKLAFLARDKGNITRSYYEDFVIVTCIANINQMLYHMKQRLFDQKQLLEIREEVMANILSINPILMPDNLVINRNFVVKIKGKSGKKEDERLLIENKFWETSYYEDIASKFEEEETSNKTEVEGPTEDKNTASKIVKSLDALNFETTRKWWKRINKYIDIKKFSKEDAVSILSHRFFHDRSSFQTYIVTICVIDSEDLFVMLDNMGVPERVAPITLMHEVYELCREVNPFLIYENAQDLSDEKDKENDSCEGPTDGKRGPNPNKMRSHASQQQTKKKKEKKRFKDVPKEELLRLAETMKLFVIGQGSAIDNIVSSIQRASVGLKDPAKPIGSFLFAGKTGCGKTKTTKVLADELIRDRDNLITIDCSEYSADHEYAKLIGSPNGYIGFEQGGILTNAVSENPFSVVVFDEVEKASTKVHDLMLQILEDGRLTDNKGQKVSFKDTIIIMTSNVGVLEVDSIKKTVGFGDVAKITEDKKNKSIEGAIKKKFKPEFINRIDSIVYFNDLTKEDYMKIIDIELYKLNENLRSNDTEYKELTLGFTDVVKDYIYIEGISEDFGARPLKRCIEKKVADKLATKLLSGDIPPQAVIEVGIESNEVTFKVGLKEPDKDSEETTDFIKSKEIKQIVEN